MGAPRSDGECASFRVAIEPVLHRLENGLVLSPRDPALLSGRALSLEGTRLTTRRPVAAQRLAILLVYTGRSAAHTRHLCPSLCDIMYSPPSRTGDGLGQLVILATVAWG